MKKSSLKQSDRSLSNDSPTNPSGLSGNKTASKRNKVRMNIDPVNIDKTRIMQNLGSSESIEPYGGNVLPDLHTRTQSAGNHNMAANRWNSPAKNNVQIMVTRLSMQGSPTINSMLSSPSKYQTSEQKNAVLRQRNSIILNQNRERMELKRSLQDKIGRMQYKRKLKQIFS